MAALGEAGPEMWFVDTETHPQGQVRDGASWFQVPPQRMFCRNVCSHAYLLHYWCAFLRTRKHGKHSFPKCEVCSAVLQRVNTVWLAQTPGHQYHCKSLFPALENSVLWRKPPFTLECGGLHHNTLFSSSMQPQLLLDMHGDLSWWHHPLLVGTDHWMSHHCHF